MTCTIFRFGASLSLVLALVGCSSSGGDGGGAPAPTSSGSPSTPAPSGTGTTPAPPPQGDAGGDAAPPPVDTTPLLTFVRDGQTQAMEAGTLKVTKTTEGRYQIEASYPAPFPRTPPLDPGSSWLTIIVSNKSVTACGNDGVVSLLYQEPNGTITAASAGVASGNCTMQVKRFGEDGLFEGSATGTLANSNFGRNWSFTVTWRQPAPT